MSEIRRIYVDGVRTNEWNETTVDLLLPRVIRLVVSIEEAEILANEILTTIANFRQSEEADRRVAIARGLSREHDGR